MHAITFACYLGVFTTSIIAYTYATVGGQYSVNVHFVPPLVTAPCQIAQFWSPQNVTCALCFCMTGSLSRCIPQPGCRPTGQNNSTSTTQSPSGGTSTATGNPESTTASTPAAEVESQTDAPSSPSEPTSSSTTTASSVPGKLRAAKPGKSRRRRHTSLNSRA